MEYYGKFPTSMKLAAIGATLAAISLSYIATSPLEYFSYSLDKEASHQEGPLEKINPLEKILKKIKLN